MARTFPCPVCKGVGGSIEEYIYFWPRTIPCSYCNGDGMIEIGGATHKLIKRRKLIDACYAYAANSATDDFAIPNLEPQIDNLIKFIEAEKTPYSGEEY